MTSRSVSASGRQEPRLHIAPRAAKTYGDLAADFSGDYGLIPDPWQQLILNDWLGESARGKWASMTCGLSVPRQNGKNGALEVRELFGMVGLGEKFLHTAHEVKTAQKHFRRLKHFFGEKANDPGAKYPELNGLVREVRNVNGQEAIYLTNGGSVEIVARSKGSGRGFTVDVIVFDEAQELGDEALEALAPAMSSAPLGNPQRIYTGTPPGPKVNGEVFTRVRAESLSTSPGRRCWHEWSCDGAVDLDDREEWAKANPALGRRLQFDVVESERGEFSDDGFARERLGMWAGSLSQAVIDATTWARAADMMSNPVDRLAVAVDVNPDQTSGAVSVAGLRADDLWHVEVVDNRNGVGWIVERVAGIVERQDIRAVIIDRDGPAAALIEPLEARGVTVTKTGFREIKMACAGFFTDVMENRLRHIDQPQLNASLAGARKRTVGDAWAWHRKNATVDISPVVSVTLALWGAQSEQVARAKKPSAAFAF